MWPRNLKILLFSRSSSTGARECHSDSKTQVRLKGVILSNSPSRFADKKIEFQQDKSWLQAKYLGTEASVDTKTKPDTQTHSDKNTHTDMHIDTQTHRHADIHIHTSAHTHLMHVHTNMPLFFPPPDTTVTM